MSLLGNLWNSGRVNRPDDAKFFTIAIGVAGSAWLAWRLTRRAIHTLYPAFLPGEPNAALLATPFENITSRHEEDDDLENVEEYDVVIVGGGTAGCVLASRLSEDPNVRVLMIEAGKSDLAVLESRIPAACAKLIGSGVDYNLKTAPEENMHDRQMGWPRGKILGGCSSVNAHMYTHCAAADYDEWAEKYQATGWSWKDLQPYFRKAENFTPDAKWPVDTTRRGKGGPWQIGYPKYLSKVFPAFLAGCKSAGIATVKDINHGEGEMKGATRVQTFIDTDGRRSSAATAYLTDEVCRRQNLKISVGMTVTRIISHPDGSGGQVAKGVELASGAHIPIRYRVRAKKDIILACGSVHTPQVLKLSGIGPREELTQNGIKVVKDLPGVGANLQDHLLIPMTINSAKGTSLNYTLKPLVSLKLLAEWLVYGTGILGSNFVEAAAWMRSLDDPSMVGKVKDQASSPQEPDMEIISCPTYYRDMGTAKPPNLDLDQWSLLQIPIRPTSVGSITLSNKSPFTPPVIHANYFSTEHDRQLSIWAFKKCCAILKGSGIFVSWELPKNADQLTDNEILEYLKDSANTCYHPVGTAKIGAEDVQGVVNPDLAVHGVQNLRVCDASIMPRIPSGHTCAPVIAIAEKLSDMLKKEYGSLKA